MRALALVLWLPVCLAFQVAETSIAKVQQAITTGQVTCEDIVSLHIARIRAYDSVLNVMVVMDTDTVLARARWLDSAFEATQTLVGTLHCIPIIIKDNYNLAGDATSGGVAALNHSISSTTCPAVARVLAAGAVVLGKANMPDFAVDGLNTNSSILGQTLNAYNSRYTPYGSSGGPAVAAAASFAVVVLGTDTNGSIQNPAAASCLVGLRPTQGFVPTQGVLPLSSLQDTAGPMARSMADLAVTMQVLAPERFPPHPSSSQRSVFPLAGKRVAFLEFTLDNLSFPVQTVVDPQVALLCNETMAHMTAQGADIVRVTSTAVLLEIFTLILWCSTAGGDCGYSDFHFSVNAFLGALAPDTPYKTLQDIVDSGLVSPSALGFAQDAAKVAPQDPQTSVNCTAYSAARAVLAKALVALMDKLDVDAFMYPTANQPPPALTDLAPPPAGLFLLNILSAVSGLPAMVFPMGFVPPFVPPHSSSALPPACFHRSIGAWVSMDSLGPHGSPDCVLASSSPPSVPRAEAQELPVGMTLLGRQLSEATLIEIATQYETDFPQRQPPPSTPPL